MNRIDSLTHSVLRFLARAKRQDEDQPSSSKSLSITGARDSAASQPAARVLEIDKFQEREIFRKDALPATGENPAPESKSTLLRVLDSDNGLDFICAQIHETEYQVFYCDEKAIGVCRHCRDFVCAKCLESGYCYAGPKHEVVGMSQ